MLMSGFSAELIDEGPAGMLDALLSKPFDRSTLARALAGALTSERPGRR